MITGKTAFTFKARWQSIRYATSGVAHFFRMEHNARIHLAATALPFGATLFLPVTRSELCALLVVVAMVWITELINTCIEKTMDFITTDQLLPVKRIKDMAAAAVLVAAVTATTIGGIIFIPKLFL